MPCPSYSLVTFPLAKKPPRAAPSALQPPAPCTSQEPQAPLSPREVERHSHPLTDSRAALCWMCCPARALPGPCSGAAAQATRGPLPAHHGNKESSEGQLLWRWRAPAAAADGTNGQLSMGTRQRSEQREGSSPGNWGYFC